MHPDDIMVWLVERYGEVFSLAAVQLLRSYTNDVYLVDCADQRFVLKLYGHGTPTFEYIDP